MDEQLGYGGVQIAESVENNNERDTEKGHHNPAEGTAHHANEGGHPRKNRLPPYHVIMGDDIEHEGADGISLQKQDKISIPEFSGHRIVSFYRMRFVWGCFVTCLSM
jgi:hypothetical protein